MYRLPQKLLPHNFIFDHAGIGDIVAAIPALKYVCDNHPQVIPYIWGPDFTVELLKTTLPKKCIIRGFSDQNKYNASYVGRNLSCDKHTSLSTHLTDFAFSSFVNTQVDDKYKNYPRINIEKINLHQFHLPEKFVILTAGFTAQVRELLPEHCNKIIDYVKSKEYEIIFLGKEESFNGHKHSIQGTFKEEIEFHKGINLINKTSLLESIAIIDKAKCLIGLDNGLMHLAGLTDTAIVGGYTTVSSRLRMPYRHNQLGWNVFPVELTIQELACINCQQNFQFTHNFDFKGCFYNDTLCIKLLTADKYIAQLQKIL